MKDNKMDWTEGLSGTSIGRFGGFRRDYYIDEKGFLCFNATAETISLEERQKIILGRLKLVKDFVVESSADWTTVKHILKYELGGKLRARATVYQSLLSPAIMYDIEDNVFWWVNERSYQCMTYVYPAQKGLKIGRANNGYDMKVDGKLKKPWILAFDNSGWIPDVPLLFVFQHQPVKVDCINDDYKKFIFSKRAGRVFVMPLLGVDRLSREEVKKWKKKLPASIEARCDLWSKIIRAYPVKCKEEYCISGNAVKIKNSFEYLCEKDDWKTAPVYLAPVPPVVVQARKYGYPVRYDRKVVDLKLPTKFGSYAAAYSKSITYEIPAFLHTDETILPVKVENDSRFNALNRRLDTYLKNPNLTFGGDNTYDPENIQDVLHNWRILAWCAWSLEEQNRIAFLKKLSSGLKNMVMSNYVYEVEPVSKRSFIREKELWSLVGTVTYDYEWYNGMQLAGLWAYTYFGNDSRSVDFIKKKWNIIEQLADYYRVFNDWAIMTFWTDTTGEHLWMDGFHYGWQGLISLVRLAKLAGIKRTEDEAQYLTAKSTLSRWCTWFMTEYVVKHRGSHVGFYKQKTDKKILNEELVAGYISRRGLTTALFYNQGNAISYLVNELFLMYMDYPEIIEKLRIGQNKLLPRDIPDIEEKFVQFSSNPGFPRKNNQHLAPAHFYFLDSLLFVKSLILREPIKKLLSYTKRLTGPVMESYLVGTHPMVVFPVDVKFLGNVWDEKIKTLTIRFETVAEKSFKIRILWKNKFKIVTGTCEFYSNVKSGNINATAEPGVHELKIHY